MYNCRIRAGHDGISFLLGSSNCRAYNNDIDIRVNTGIRVRDSKGIRLDHNIFYGLHRKGWCCTEMEENVQIEIDHNIFHDYIGFQITLQSNHVMQVVLFRFMTMFCGMLVKYLWVQVQGI